MKTSYKLLLLAVLLMTFCMASARKTYIGPNAVDLGLSVLWGDKNMQDVSLNTLYFYWAQTSNGGNGMTLVGTDEEYPDNICGTQYDIATEYYGDGWRMPTADEFRELYEKCSSRFASDGVTFTAANGNSITLGLVGYIKNGTNTNDYSYYWTGTKGNPGIWSPYISQIGFDSNTPTTTYQRYAPDAFGFNSSGLKNNDKICDYLYSNQYQCAIRPVKDKVGSDATAYAILDNGTLSFYYDSSKKLRSGKAYDIAASYTSSNLPGWAADSLSIKKVVFNTSFAKFSPTSTAFWFGGYYNNLATITGLNFLNTANVTNMNNMFSKCKSLRTLDLSTFVTSKVTNMSAMFYNCSALESLNLQNFDTTNVIDMSFMFANCSSLQSLEVSFFNTAKVTSMSSMFTNCSKLKSLELRNFNTSNVTKMGWMFYGCNSLTDLYVSTFDTSKVTDVNCMFYDCENLTTIDVSGFNTSNATNMSFMFRGCSRLEKLYMGGFYTSNVTNMMCMFYGCTSLTTIYVKENWNTDKVTNSANMFGSCNSLVGGAGTKFSTSHIDKGYARIDGTNTPGYFTNMAPALASGTKAYAVYNNNVLTFYYDNKSSSRTGTKYEVKASYTSKNKPGWVNDYYRRIFTKAVFDSSFASYQPTSTAFWFYDCSLMKSIEGITNLKTSKVTSMAEMFRYCNLLNNLDLRTFDTSNVTDMSCMFCYCHSLTNLKVSSFNTSKVTDMSHLFHQCPLSSIDVSNFDTKNVTNMLLMFADCTQLKTLDLKNFNTAKVSDMGYMFCSCYALTTIYAGNLWSTANLRNGYRMFTDDYRLVGSMGTVYDPAHTNQAYAHIDGGRCNPGYLYGDITPADLGPKEAYAALDGGVLTFYYDSFKECTDGKIYPIKEKYTINDLPGWHEDRNEIITGVFDSSFADYRPTNTSFWFLEINNMSSLLDVKYLNTSEVTAMSYMFCQCNSLENLDVSHFNTAKVTAMNCMFYQCESLESIDVSHFNTSRVTTMNSMFQRCNLLPTINIEGFDTQNVTDMSWMFAECKNLNYLDVSNFKTGKVVKMIGMFYYCVKLPAIDVSNFNTSNVTNMAKMFMACEVLENLNLKNFNTAKVDNMNSMFYMCYKLQSLDVSNFNTANVTDMCHTFDWLRSVKTLDLRNFNTSNVTTMRAMFSGNDVLENINISSFDTRNVIDMEAMFNQCPKLKSVDISSFNTAKVENMYRMFSYDYDLTTIYAGDGWSTASVKESDLMFAICSKLVGGAGTTYDSNHTDHEYARIDGGPSHPGYFTQKGLSCDVNGDGNVDVADIATIIDVMAGKGDAATEKAADVNGDGNVDVADIATVITEMAARARLQQTVIEEE